MHKKQQPSSPSFPFSHCVDSQQVPHTHTHARTHALLRGIKNMKHFLPFFLPPTVKTESPGSVTRVMWNPLDQYPLTLASLACMGSGPSWNMHRQPTVINVGHCCAQLPLFLFSKKERKREFRIRAQFKYRYTAGWAWIIEHHYTEAGWRWTVNPSGFRCHMFY